ncbi:MAG: dicarboxylate/amino acid:cation symporter [Gemmatimonadetes bacterium]|nr:dicarboxylate/amino acid:cation symporter [Gemmatimonadota bacterium]
MMLSTKIFIGLVGGIAVGGLARILGIGWLVDVLVGLEPLGDGFIRLISMVVVPLVVGSLTVAMASLGDGRRLAGIGGRTLAYFLGTTVIAVGIGVALAWIVQPGVGMDPATREALSAKFQSDVAAVAGPGTAERGWLDALVELVPRNPVAAAAQMDLLPLIVATVLFGLALGAIPEERRRVIIIFFQAINDAAMVIIGWFMKLAPYAVFALIAATVARFGTDLLERLLVYSLVVVAGCVLHVLGTFSVALRFLARVKIVDFYRTVAEAPLLAFSTASSNATLPVSMDVAERKLGISNRVTSFVIPAGATLNMNGSALYKGVTAVFILQVYGLPFGIEQLVIILVTATAAAVAGVGIPGSSLVTTLIVLNALGLGPQAAAGIALVVGLDRILDMFRTAVNVTGDLTCAAYIARVEGELTHP